jgi:toxin ParE1/3/4
MVYKLSKVADRDLKSILSYTALTFGEKQAISYAQDLERALTYAAKHPLASRERKDVQPPHRVYVFRAHLIFYLVEPKRIWVTRILHSHQDWQSGLDS